MVSLLLRDLWAFLLIALVQWKVLMGGVLMLAIKVIERYRGHEVAPLYYWSLTIGFIGVAVFSAWREERRKWERLGGMATLPLTLRELVAEYRDRTTIHADQLTKDRIGRQYTVSWPIKDIEKNIVYLQTPPESPEVRLCFPKKSQPTLKALQKGERITVLGRILRLRENQVTLTGCELEKVDTLENETKR